MRHLAAAVAVLAVGFGVAGIAYGEADDSPGLQLLSALLVIGAVAIAVRLRRRAR